MKYLLLLFIWFTVSCNPPNRYHKAENALDAGREFINALLKGDFKTAAFYSISNEENKRLLRQFKNKYNSQSAEVKKQYQQAVINIYEVVEISSAETIINFSNSYDKTRHKLKVLKPHSDWLIDIKYTFDGSL